MTQTLAPAGSLWYPTVERVLQLTDLQVPPPKYDAFLAEAVDAFLRFVLEINNVKSLDELTAKNKTSWVTVGELQDEAKRLVIPPVGISFGAQLQYSRPSGDKVPNVVYRSDDYTEYLLNPHGGEPIKLASYAEDLAVVVRAITEEIGRRYADTQGALPSNLFISSKSAKDAPINSLVRGFNFNLHLQTQPASQLETDVSLINDGAISRDGTKLPGDLNSVMAVPGIHIDARTLIGHLDGVRTLTDRLANLVHKYYPTQATEYRESYSTNILPSKR